MNPNEKAQDEKKIYIWAALEEKEKNMNNVQKKLNQTNNPCFYYKTLFQYTKGSSKYYVIVWKPLPFPLKGLGVGVGVNFNYLR